jgi:hypothetical protein
MSANDPMAQQGPFPLPGFYAGMYPKEYEQYSASYGNRLDRIGWKWWDTQTYVSGTTTQLPQWFNVRATPDLGNMEVAFQLAAPKAFLIRAIRFFIKQRPRSVTPALATGAATGAIDNVAQLINTGVFVLTIGNKQFAMEPLWVLTAGGGAMGMLALSAISGASTVDYAQNGIADPRAVNTLSIPIFIPPQLNFSAVVSWPAALTLSGGNTDITFLLDGDILRPVQ